MTYIGIDLAWTLKNETGICIFKDQTCVLLDAQVYSNEALVQIIMDHLPCIVSIDAPLVVKNESGGRAIDGQLMRRNIHGHHLKLYATSRNYMLKTFKSIRGEDILNLLKGHLKLGENLTETYPTGVFLSLLPDIFDKRYKISSKLPLADLKKNVMIVSDRLKKMGFLFEFNVDEIGTKKAYKRYEDMFDGVLCAVNSYYFDKKKCLTLHDDNGCLTLPLLMTEVIL